MLDFSTRVQRPELIDEGQRPDEEVRRNLLDIRRINRMFGNRKLLLEIVAKEVRDHRLTRFSLLDVASGSCDLPMAILEWARRQRLPAQIFALEYWPRHLAFFRRELRAYPSLHPFAADAFHAPVPDQAFDFVTCCHFLHHLAEERAIELLKRMSQWARHALIVTDLERHAIPYYFFRLFAPLFTQCAMSREDGLISLRQSFRREELERIAKQVGGLDCAVERRFPYRLVLVGRR